MHRVAASPSKASPICSPPRCRTQNKLGDPIGRRSSPPQARRAARDRRHGGAARIGVEGVAGKARFRAA
jgi:hypothetical protein